LRQIKIWFYLKQYFTGSALTLERLLILLALVQVKFLYKVMAVLFLFKAVILYTSQSKIQIKEYNVMVVLIVTLGQRS